MEGPRGVLAIPDRTQLSLRSTQENQFAFRKGPVMTDEDESSQGSNLRRRKLLYLVGTGVIGVTGGVYVSANRSRSSPAQPETGSNSTETASTPTREARPEGINIEEYGAVSGQDTRTVAQRNAEAIRHACHEAGREGTVYVPEGEYFFGGPDDGRIFQFGEEEPAGVSFVGEGPRESKLILTATIERNRSYRGFTYNGKNSDVDHGNVTIRDLCFDGNYENLDMVSGVTVWGFNVFGKGDFTFDNVWIRGWWANGTRFTGPSVTIRGSTFQENAIGVARTNDTVTVGHHIVARPPANSSILVEDTEFLRCSGSVINRRRYNGDVTMRRVWIRDAGSSVLKLSKTNGITRIENCYVELHTDWLERNLPQKIDMRGRWFLHRVYGADYTPTVILDRVEARDFTRGFILCYQHTDLIFEGDKIAVHNAAIDEDREVAIRGDEGIHFDVYTMSVHDTDGEMVFRAPGSTGAIQNLFRNGNGDLGEVGDVTIGDHPNSEPLDFDVVKRREVGIDAGSYV